MLQWLLESGLKLNSKDEFNDTSLIAATEHDSAECMKILLKGGANPNEKTKDQDPAIVYAKSAEAVSLLLAAGANINELRSDGSFLLHSAAEFNNLKFVAELLALGADPNAANNSHTALHRAFIFDYLDIASVLIQAGAKVDAQDFFGDTILHACKSKKAIDLAL